MIQIWTLFLALGCWTCTAPVSETLAPSESEPRKTIYLVDHGYHTTIGLRRADIPDNIWPKLGNFPDMEYLEVGWGDKDLYQMALSVPFEFFLKAAMVPTASVLHIVSFNEHVPAYFPNKEIIRIELSSAGFERLSRTIASSFTLDKAGNITSLGPGLYGNSHFYSSRETYHLFNTCNVWNARALRIAGLPITAATSVRSEGLMSQARKSGVVVQSEPEPSE
jgi:uncharacterized protein (TIGR02117 family)